MTSEEDNRNRGELAEGRTPDGRFAKGNKGRPYGTRTRATKAVMEILDGQVEQITEKALSLALQGDTTALRLCLERIAPPRKDAPVEFDLPKMEGADDAAKAAASILAAVSQGDLTPTEGAHVMALIETYRRTLEATEIEKRLTELENAR
ncbi:MAG: hypothetical protein AAFP98_01390 [Pseudomonadota bacterium]